MAKSTAITGARIKVVGLGGSGCNAVTRMVRQQLHGVEFIAMNTDAQQLQIVEAGTRVQLGEKLTRGLGAGGDHNIGRRAAEESRDEIRDALSGADMIFIAAGMGGGTGTGSAAVVAEVARATGALTIAVVTRPFSFEGKHRSNTAEAGIKDLTNNVDTVIIIPNDRLFDLIDRKTTVDGAFRLADEVLHQGVQAITEVITVPGLINLDFADVRTIMRNAGPAWMSIGRGTGQNRAADAARAALASPLLDVTVKGSKGVLFNIAGSSSLTLYEVNTAAEVIRQAVDPRANVIFGVVLDNNMGADVRLTLIATGFANRDSDAERDKEMSRVLKGIGDEELDLPSFTRHQGATSQNASMR
jgi:cell division protein FtsZ